MKRGIATLWHLSFSAVAAGLYFAFVLPRWWELTGDTSHAVGTAARIAAGVVIALAALPVVFTLLRSRKPEFGTPALALSLLTASVVAHVLAGVLIVGTAISEIWLSLDNVGQWLFGIYGAAAAIAVLGIVGFYLSSVAELPPPPPKPIKPKKDKSKRRGRNKDETEGADGASAETDDEKVAGDDVTDAADGDTETADDADGSPDVESTAVEPTSTADEASETGDSETIDEGEDTTEAESSAGGLRNRRPTGKESGSHRRRRSRRGVAVED